MLSPIIHDNDHARYRRLIVALLAVACALAAVAWFYVRPRWQDYDQLQQEVMDLEEEAKDSRWPDDPQVLQDYLNLRLTWNNGTKQNNKQDFPGLKEEEKRILNRATKYLRQKIVENFPTIADENDWSAIDNFIRNSTRIDFKYLANRLEADFAEKNLQIPEDIVQITEAKPEPVYQKILQLWTVEYLFRKVEDYDLAIVTAEDSDTADIQALPPLGFILDKNDTDAYLWAFPVKVTVRGTLQDFLHFQKALISRKYFFPLRNLTIHTYPPTQIPTDKESLELKHQTITFTVVAFFQTQDIPKPATRKANKDSN